jgi:predicted kinase
MPASGKSSLAKELVSILPLKLLSTDDYAEQNKVTYYQAARITLRQAVDLAARGQHVVVDSFVIEDLFRLPKSQDYEVKLIGLWCPLNSLKKRFDHRAGSANAHLKSHLTQDYMERYGDKTPESIKATLGTFKIGENQVRHDQFFNTEIWSTSDMALGLKTAYF